VLKGLTYPDIAELVLNHGELFAMLLSEDVIEQSSLTTSCRFQTEKGDQVLIDAPKRRTALLQSNQMSQTGMDHRGIP